MYSYKFIQMYIPSHTKLQGGKKVFIEFLKPIHGSLTPSKLQTKNSLASHPPAVS